jgi:hypothetical protein
MPQLDLDEDEVEALVDLLESKLRDLSYEISDTDTREFRNQLKSRRELLKRVLSGLKGGDS